MKKLHFQTESATVAINSLAQQKIAAGVKIFNLSAGEPKLSPHPVIVRAVKHALEKGKTLYPPVGGIPELKFQVCNWMNRQYNCQFRPENCLITNGGKLGLYLLLQLLLKPKDEVMIASPYWVSYPAITQLFGGVPRIIETRESEGWKLTLNCLKKTYHSKSKILILNNAANPTGVIYTRQELAAILKFAYEKKLLVVSDEVYSELIYDNKTYVSCGSFPEYQNNNIIIQSCSKNFSMTGFRVGFVFANKDIIQLLTSLLGQSTSGVTTLSQWAAVDAFKAHHKINSWIKKTMQKRRNIMIKAFKKYFNINLNPPASALYVFVALKDLGLKKVLDSAAFCSQALEHAHVALVPGSAFGKEGFVRFSFGVEEENLISGIQSLAAYIRKGVSYG